MGNGKRQRHKAINTKDATKAKTANCLYFHTFWPANALWRCWAAANTETSTCPDHNFVHSL